MVSFVVMTIMIMIIQNYLLEILFIGVHLVTRHRREDGTTMEPLS